MQLQHFVVSAAFKDESMFFVCWFVCEADTDKKISSLTGAGLKVFVVTNQNFDPCLFLLWSSTL